MKKDRRVVSCSVLLLTACASVQHVASSRVSAQHAAIIRVDSAAVEAILGAFLDEQAKHPPSSEVSVDTRADAKGSSFRSVAGGRRGSLHKADDLETMMADSALLGSVAESRRRILRQRGLAEGTPLNYPECSGILAYRRPGDSTARTGCPSVSKSYVVIGLPHSGVYPELRKMPGARTEPLPGDTSDVWSVVASVTGIGPAGGGWFASVYVLSHAAGTGGLKVLEKVLIAWAE